MNDFLPLILGLINLSCTLAVVNMVRSRDPEHPPAVVHEVAFTEDEKITSALDARAAGGWEVVTCRRANSGGSEYGTYGYECVFRRVIAEKDTH